ncbi:hypothetical protein GCM10009133_38950 [Cocleimonas flava]|uniref:Putative peroxiredoxin n=1 Tax=Cocleimonas flava TaxID=634765 RepID=A0A4R1F2A3_9GAMM|nr:DsrE family protein [Cocleimonas flava]TCJ88267.1 putative peroxiredoxin [Cocleimonas flava]
MKSVKQILMVFALVFVAFSQGVYADSDGKKLFVNITSDDINKAAMAIGFSMKVRMEKKIPVTIFLNVEGVRIADKNIPEHKHSTGKSLKGMLADFMQAGGKVIVCPMCMKNVGGLSKEDLIDGVVVGGSDVTWPALFADDTVVLSY